MARDFHARVREDGLTTGPFLRSDGGFGQSVTRYPLGDTGSPQTVQAVVVLDDETKVSQEGIGNPSVRSMTRETIPRTGILEVTELQAVDDRDTWSLPNFGPDYATLKWITTRIEGRDAGMKAVYVERIEDISTSRFSRR